MLGTPIPFWLHLRPRVLVAAASIFYLLLGGCTEANPPPLPAVRVPADRSVQENDIREAIFRYEIHRQYLPGLVFLSIDGEDPSDDFMARFAGSKPPVRKASGTYVKENPLEEMRGDPNKRDPLEGMLRDRSNDKGALLLHVGAISWITVTRVEATGGTYCGWTCGYGGVYRVLRKDGQWVVEEYVGRMVF